MRHRICLLLALMLLVVLSGTVREVHGADEIRVEDRFGEPGQPGLFIPVVGEWDSPLFGYTISIEFDTIFMEVHDLSIAGTVAEGAEYFVPQWSNGAGFLTAEVVMDAEYPGAEGNAIPPGSGLLLNIMLRVKEWAPRADSTALHFRDGLGSPPRENRFFGRVGSLPPPDSEGGWLRTIFVLSCDFESSGGGFSATGEWEWGPDSLVNPGNKLWGIDLCGDYDPDACYGLTSPDANVPEEDWNFAYLTFSQRYRIRFDKGDDSSDDGGNIQRFTDNLFDPWEAIYPDWKSYDVSSIWNDCIEYDPGYAGVSEGYPAFVKAGFDLSGKDHPQCFGTCYRVQWLFGSNESPSVDRGWYIDDVRIACAPLECGPFFIRGDVNNDGGVDSVDVSLLEAFYRGQIASISSPCDRADVNDDGICCNWDDVAFLGEVVASGGAVIPPWPYPHPGIDSSPDFLPSEDCSPHPMEDFVFIRGDVQADGDHDLFDVLFMISWLGGKADPPPCINAADVSDDERVDLFDAIRLLLWLTGLDSPPPEPCCDVPPLASSCGQDPTPGALSCNSYAPCGWNPPSAMRTAMVRRSDESWLMVENAVLRGNAVEVPVIVSNAEPLMGFHFTIEYDPELLTASRVDNAGLITEGFDYFGGGVGQAGVVTVVAVSDLEVGDGASKLPAGQHRVARIVFEVNGAALPREVLLSVASSFMAMDHRRELEHLTSDGRITPFPSVSKHHNHLQRGN